VIIEAAVSLAVVRLAVNIWVAFRCAYRAWQLRNDSRILGRGTKWYLLGMGGANLFGAIIFLFTTLTGTMYFWGISQGWWLAAANGLEIIPFIVLDAILGRKPETKDPDTDEVELFIVLDYLRKVIAAPVFVSFPKEVKDFMLNAEDELGNLVTKHSLFRQAKEMSKGAQNV